MSMYSNTDVDCKKEILFDFLSYTHIPYWQSFRKSFIAAWCILIEITWISTSIAIFSIYTSRGTNNTGMTDSNRQVAAWRVEFCGLASNASRILLIVAASVLLRGLPGGSPLWMLLVSSISFLYFPIVDGCRDTLKS